jgi:hypothetical protein
MARYFSLIFLARRDRGNGLGFDPEFGKLSSGDDRI